MKLNVSISTHSLKRSKKRGIWTLFKRQHPKHNRNTTQPDYMKMPQYIYFFNRIHNEGQNKKKPEKKPKKKEENLPSPAHSTIVSVLWLLLDIDGLGLNLGLIIWLLLTVRLLLIILSLRLTWRRRIVRGRRRVVSFVLVHYEKLLENQKIKKSEKKVRVKGNQRHFISIG